MVEYTFAPGDTDGNGLIDLRDVAAFQNCFADAPLTGACSALDLTRDGTLDLTDFAALQAAFAGP